MPSGRARFTQEQADFVRANGPRLGWYGTEHFNAYRTKFGDITLTQFRNFSDRVRGGERGLTPTPSLDELTAPPAAAYRPAQASDSPYKHPTGWEPGIDTAKGIITSGPTQKRDVAWDKELERLGFDPEQFEVVEPFQVRSWEGFFKGDDGDAHKVTLWYHRASIIRRREHDDRIDVAKLTELVVAVPRPPTERKGKSGYVFVWADTQIGKGDGDGSKGIVDRMLGSLDDGVHRYHELQHTGRKVETILVHIAADLYEATAGHYAMQTYKADLNLREQRAVARRLVLAAVTRFAQTGAKVLVSVVPGNHTENRLNGKAYTTFGDSGDVEIVEQVAEICKENSKAFRRVAFIIPHEQMELTLNLHGTILGLAHGHQCKGSVEKWWKDQTLGRQPIGEADILITGHKHRAVVQRLGDRWHFQAPTLESESTWQRHTHGEGGHPGVLTFVTADHKWSDLQIL